MQDLSRTVESIHHKVTRDEKLLSFCENQKFSDICIVASDDQRFHAHKCVLSASSDYFMAMIGGDLKEARESEVKIQEIEGDILKHILAFMYTGTIELQTKTVEDVLTAANYLQIQSLIIECYTFMGEKLDVRNCLGIAIFAEQQGLMELSKKASEFASKNFAAVQKEEEFLKLNEEQLSMLISNKELCVSSEEITFLSIVKWIEHDQMNREKSAYNLFSKVRYQLLSSNFIKQHRSKLQKYQIECLELVCTWLEWHLSPDSREWKPMDISKSTGENELVLFSCGAKCIYNSDLNRWTYEKISEISNPDCIDKVVNVQTKLIFVYPGSLTCLDLHTNAITELPNLLVDRRNFGLAVLNEELYAVGGRKTDKTNRWTRYVEKFNFSSKIWQTVVPMTTEVSNPKVAVAGGLLYVVSEESVLECFTPDSNEWTNPKPFKSMNDYYDFGITGFNGKLYLVGGICRNECMKSLFSYDPLLEKWETETDMRFGLYNTKCTSWNNQLIVAGGMDSSRNFHNIIQKYNPSLKTWTFLKPPDGVNLMTLSLF